MENVDPFLVAAPKVTSGLFSGTSATTGDSGASTTNVSTTNTTSNIFGSGIFGKPSTTNSTATTPAVTASTFSLGGNKDAPAPAPASKP